MFHYEKKLQYPVKIKNANPKLASWIISQYGGPDTRRLRGGQPRATGQARGDEAAAWPWGAPAPGLYGAELGTGSPATSHSHTVSAGPVILTW
jgi:hypothetical protein